MNANGLVVALSAIIKGAVDPVAARPILAAAPQQELALAVQKTDPAGNIARTLTSILSQGNQNNRVVTTALRNLPSQPPSVISSNGSIGDVFWAGRKHGTAFGSIGAPTFRRIGQTTTNNSYKGWSLRKTEVPEKFEFIYQEYKVTGKTGNIRTAIASNAQPNIARNLLRLITGAVNVNAASRVVNAQPAQTPSMWQRVLGSIKGMVSPRPGGNQRTANQGTGNPGAQPMGPGNGNQGNVTPKPTGSRQGNGNPEAQPPPLPPKPPPLPPKPMGPRQRPGTQGTGTQGNGNQGTGIPRTRNQGTGTQGNGNQGTGTQGNGNKGTGTPRTRNQGTETQKPANQRPVKPSMYNRLFGKRNFKKPNVSNALRRKEPPTQAEMTEIVKTEVEKLEGMSNTAQCERLGKLLKQIPEMYKSARDYIRLKIKEKIRNISKLENPSQVKKQLAQLEENLSLSPKSAEIKKMIETEKKRAEENIRNNVGTGQRRGESIATYIKRLTRFQRYPSETNNNYSRRRQRYSHENNNNYRHRLETYRRRRDETNSEYENRMTTTLRRQQLEQNEIMRRRRLRGLPVNVNNTGSRVNNNGPRGLPINETTAIARAGGLSTVNSTVEAVPGGVPEIARAAEILNETNGNVQQAVNIKGADPVAIQAVQRLGGPKNAINAVQGLETHKRKKRSAVKKSPPGPRIKLLKKTIRSVKKRKLISIVAYNITKTNNIHEDNKRLKEYYQKVVKSAILRTPLANIVKKSKARVRAKKRSRKTQGK